MAQNMFTYGTKREEFTDEAAKREFERIEEELLEQMHQFELPEALLAENMMQLLDGVTPGVTQPARVINYKKEYTRFIAYAACFVLVIYGFARVAKHQNDIIAVKNEAAASYSVATAAMGMMPECMLDSAAPAETKMMQAPAAAAPAAPVNGAAEEETVDSAYEEMLVVVNGVLYRSNGEVSDESTRGTVIDGKITMSVDADAVPAKDGESNFGTGCEYQVIDDDSIDVLIDGVWYRFVKAN